MNGILTKRNDETVNIKSIVAGRTSILEKKRINPRLPKSARSTCEG
ncbi:hypothetical protein [Flavobacterium sp. ZT3R18]|nr:hypothetical protein [Flavobacterium sp. ZT3R18]